VHALGVTADGQGVSGYEGARERGAWGALACGGRLGVVVHGMHRSRAQRDKQPPRVQRDKQPPRVQRDKQPQRSRCRTNFRVRRGRGGMRLVFEPGRARSWTWRGMRRMGCCLFRPAPCQSSVAPSLKGGGGPDAPREGPRTDRVMKRTRRRRAAAAGPHKGRGSAGGGAAPGRAPPYPKGCSIIVARTARLLPILDAPRDSQERPYSPRCANWRR
jgi:hypothetical protein